MNYYYTITIDTNQVTRAIARAQRRRQHAAVNCWRPRIRRSQRKARRDWQLVLGCSATYLAWVVFALVLLSG